MTRRWERTSEGDRRRARQRLRRPTCPISAICLVVPRTAAPVPQRWLGCERCSGPSRRARWRHLAWMACRRCSAPPPNIVPRRQKMRRRKKSRSRPWRSSPHAVPEGRGRLRRGRAGHRCRSLRQRRAREHLHKHWRNPSILTAMQSAHGGRGHAPQMALLGRCVIWFRFFGSTIYIAC